MIMEPATYAAAYATSADLDAIIAQVRAHVAACRVETLALETHTDNLTDPILGLCALGWGRNPCLSYPAATRQHLPSARHDRRHVDAKSVRPA